MAQHDARSSTTARGMVFAPGTSSGPDLALITQVVESLPVGIWLMDGRGRIWLANAAAKQIWAGTLWVGPESYGKFKAWSCSDGHEYAASEWPSAVALASGRSVAGQRMVIQRFTGELLTVIHAAIVLRDASGATTGVMAIFQDIEREARAQAALKHARDDLALILSSIPSILIVVDRDGCVRMWNAAAAATFTMPEAGILGRPFWGCAIPWDWTAIGRIANDGRVSRPERIDDVHYRRSDGSNGTVGFAITPITRSDGSGNGSLWLGADTTEQRAMEARLRQAQKLEAVGQLAAGVAHEINTPLQFISDNQRFISDAVAALLAMGERVQQAAASATDGMRGVIDAAVDAADLPWIRREAPAALAQSRDGIAKVLDIVRALSEFSQPSADRIADVDLARTLANAVMVTRNQWHPVADLDLSVEPGLPPVPVVPGAFNQIIVALISNAVHAIEDRRDPPGVRGRISIAACVADGQAVMTVADSGCGIPEAVRHRVFEPFFSTKPVGRGTGSSLALARTEIMGRLNGEIGFASQTGIGTTFTVRIPCAPPTRHR